MLIGKPPRGGDSPLMTGSSAVLVMLVLDLDKVNEWVAKGAQPSDRVKTLIKDVQKAQAAA